MIHLNRYIYIIIRASGELQLILQQKYANVILLSTKLMLSRLSATHTLYFK
jgi:hypothetical protein